MAFAFANPVLFVVEEELGAAIMGQGTAPLFGLLSSVVHGRRLLVPLADHRPFVTPPYDVHRGLSVRHKAPAFHLASLLRSYYPIRGDENHRPKGSAEARARWGALNLAALRRRSVGPATGRFARFPTRVRLAEDDSPPGGLRRALAENGEGGSHVRTASRDTVGQDRGGIWTKEPTARRWRRSC